MNYHLKEEKYRKQVARYSPRKLSIGVASVALFSFVLSSPQVYAATSSESNTSNAASVQTSGASASSSTSTDDVRVAGNQASDGNLIDKTTTTTTTKDSQGTTTQTADQTYDNVQAAGNDYANQINNLNKTTSDYKQAVQAFQNSLKKYNDTVNSYQVAKQEYEQALAKYSQEQAEYQRYKERNAQNLADFKNDSNLTDVSQTTTSSIGNEETVTSATVKLPTELEKAIKEAQQLGMTVNQNDSSEADSSADALSKYATMTEAINKAITEYKQALSNYEAQMAVYADQKKKWGEENMAFKEYQKQAAESQEAGAVVAAQGLVFEQQKDATMTIEGADTYMTKEVSDQLNSKDVISRFDKASLDAIQDASGNKTAYQQNNPHGEAENTWIVLKKGQPVTVTYHNLTGATYNGKPIDHVVYKYELESSSDGTNEVMAQIMHDPTETIWVGSNSTDPNNHLRVKMTIAFYGSDGNKFDTSDGKAILSLASLNHYTTIPYISDSGQQETIQMNHLERVNIGNNEFVGIPGSSVTLNENGWVYSVNSNQRVSEFFE